MLILSTDLFGIREAMMNFWRSICISLDVVVYYFVEVVLQLIMDLSKVQIFSQTTINTFTKRIYIILGLVMVFKMMISFIQILIDPDTLTDKEKGAGAVLKRVVIALVLIVLVPSIFSTARKIQSYVLPIIPKVILGATEENNLSDGSIGRNMAWYSFLPFFDYAGTCDDGSIRTIEGSENPKIISVADAQTYINEKDEDCGEGEFKYKYSHKRIISTAVGVYLLFTLVTVAVNTAVRAIKFGICELIAPIPIASYIDPKTSKSTFDKWVSTSIKVYLDLFIQLIVVYFVAFIFSTYFADKDNYSIIIANTGGSTGRAILVYLFIIVGLLSFVKQFPKFLSDLLGLGTNGDIAGIFKGAGWKQVGSTLAVPASVAHAGLSAMSYSRGKGEGIRSIGRGLGASLRSTKASLSAAINGKGPKGVYDTYQSVHGSTMRRINKASAIKEQRGKYDDDMKKYKASQTMISNLKSQLDTENKNYTAAQDSYYEAMQRYSDAMAVGDKKAAFNAKRDSRYASANMSTYQDKINRINDAIKIEEETLRPVRPSSYGIGKYTTMAKNFAGVPVPDSKSYSEAAKIMMSGKKIFNDAKDKVREDPTLIRKSFTIKDKNGNSYGTSTFDKVFAAHREAQIGGRAMFNGTWYDSAVIESIYGETLKQAATEYVNSVQNGSISNGTMKQDISIFEKSKDNEMVIDSADQSLITYDTKNPGEFLKKADEVGKTFESRAQDLRSVEENK